MLPPWNMIDYCSKINQATSQSSLFTQCFTISLSRNQWNQIERRRRIQLDEGRSSSSQKRVLCSSRTVVLRVNYHNSGQQGTWQIHSKLIMHIAVTLCWRPRSRAFSRFCRTSHRTPQKRLVAVNFFLSTAYNWLIDFASFPCRQGIAAVNR